VTAIRIFGSALMVALAAGCGGSQSADVSRFQRPGAPPTYWLGESFDGLPLMTTDVGTGRPDFIYGTCEGRSGEGCAPPLELQQWPLFERPPGGFEVAPGRPASCRVLSKGGITAAEFETTGGVEVYLGDRVVVIFGARDLATKAMRELRPVRVQEPALPPPPARVVEALERCATTTPDKKLRELRAAGGPAGYWLGRSFAGHPLVSAEGDATWARLVYGRCAGDELGCWHPLELEVGPLEVPGAVRSGQCPRRLGEAQGAPALFFPNGHTVVVLTRTRTIRIVARDLELLPRAANALRRLDEAAPSGLEAPAPEVKRELRRRCG
jgi:hypothetical protein